ncbi:MAG: ABC transporter ATP-binding protein [Thermodesulfobacteriota bacterium]
MKAVTARNISLTYGGEKVLEKVCLEITGGEFFIIIGPNGAGKSSLLKTLTALISPAAGAISFFGRGQRDYGRREFARLAALVPQEMEPGFPYTVADTVLQGRTPHLGLFGRETAEDHTIAREAMAAADVLHLAHRPLREVSGGEKQRVIIARAICQQPRLLFLDEPTASLDPGQQIRIMDLLERLRRQQGLTICMVSHDLNLAANYADRLLLLHRGRTIAVGAPEVVLRPALLESCYGCRLLVDHHPATGMLRVMGLPEKFSDLANSST